MQENQEIIYRHKNNYSLEEHIRFEEFSFRLSKKWKFVAKRALFFFGLAVALFVALVIKGSIKATDLILPGVMVAAAIIVIASNGPMGRKISWKLNEAVHDMEQQYNFYNDYFEYITPQGGITIAYSDIYHVGETANNIYIMLNPQQGMSLVKNKCPGGLSAFLKMKFEETHS